MPRPFFHGARTLALTAALLLAACSAPVEKAKPALWAVRDADTTLYFLGTVHQLPSNLDWDDGPVGRAIDEAQVLMLELSREEVARVPEVYERLATRPAEPSLDMRFGPELGGRLLDLSETEDLPLGQMLASDDWAIVVLIGRAQAERAALSPAHGVEGVLTSRFEAAGKPIRGLETAEAQLSLFDTLPADVQRRMLARSVAGWNDGPKQIGDMIAAWKTGNIDALDAMMARDIGGARDVGDALINQRNARWADWAERRMAEPGTVLVAVGAGHLVGEASVLADLRAAGLTVTRLQ